MERMYKNPLRWGFHTQVEMITLGIEQYRKQGVLDGSHELAYWVYSQHSLTYDERVVLRRLYTNLLRTVDAPDLTIYLKADAEVLYERIRTRGRTMESVVTLEDVKQLNRYFNSMISEDPYRNLVFDYNDFQDMPALLESTIHYVRGA